MDRETVDVGNVFADAPVVKVGHETVDGNVLLAGARIVDVGCKAVDENIIFAGIVCGLCALND